MDKRVKNQMPDLRVGFRTEKKRKETDMEIARGVVGVLLALTLIVGVFVAGSYAPKPMENSPAEGYFDFFPTEIS